MLDGFSGRHIKVFIDGVPQEGTGTGFSLNNLPVNYAERIEVYKGVVPVGFGADAIGGVVNVVTKKNVNRFSVDASYSFGSFNTHKSYLNISHKLKSGLFYEVNAFQNYSDNNYYVNNWVRTFTVNPDGSVTKHPVDKTDIKRVKRFNDTFHNEAVIGKVGVKEKPWADRLWLGMGYSKFYKEIQTGVYQEIVFGQKHRHGYSMLPAFEYSKHNLFVKGLDVQLHANYNHNITYNVDTTGMDNITRRKARANNRIRIASRRTRIGMSPPASTIVSARCIRFRSIMCTAVFVVPAGVTLVHRQR